MKTVFVCTKPGLVSATWFIPSAKQVMIAHGVAGTVTSCLTDNPPKVVVEIEAARDSPAATMFRNIASAFGYTISEEKEEPDPV